MLSPEGMCKSFDIEGLCKGYILLQQQIIFIQGNSIHFFTYYFLVIYMLFSSNFHIFLFRLHGVLVPQY
jgi:hypothetical protein